MATGLLAKANPIHFAIDSKPHVSHEAKVISHEDDSIIPDIIAEANGHPVSGDDDMARTFDCGGACRRRDLFPWHAERRRMRTNASPTTDTLPRGEA